MKTKSQIAILLVATALAGCADSSVTGDWSCPQNQPEGCNTLASSDAIARGHIGSRVNTGHLPIPLSPAVAEAMADDSEGDDSADDNGAIKYTAALPEPRPQRAESPPEVQRIPEEVTRIRIGAFEDSDGNYHPPGVMHIILKPAEWREVQ